MALTRRTQILQEEEVTPGTEITSFEAADVLEVLDAEFSDSRPLLDRTPASETLSNPKKAVGAGEGSLSFGVDWRGGASSQQPDFDSLLQACGLRSTDEETFTFGTGGADEAISAGDVLQGATSGALAIATEDCAVSGASVKGVYVTPDTAFSASENMTNKRTGNTAGAFASEAAVGSTTCYHPLSKRRLQFTTTASWSSDPAVGSGVTFDSGGAATGGGIVLKVSTTTTWVEMVWGDVAASDSCTSTEGYTATIHATPAFDQDYWPTMTIRQNRHNLIRALYGAIGTCGFAADAGAGMRGTFEFQGKKGTHTDGAYVAPSTRNTKLPPRLQKSAALAHVKVDGVKLPVASVEFALGNELVMQRDGNRAEGIYITQATARGPTVTLVIHQVPTATWDYDTLRGAGTTARLDIRVDGGSANGFTFVAGAAQIAEITDGDDSGLATTSVTYELTRSVEDDEFAMRFSTLA